MTTRTNFLKREIWNGENNGKAASVTQPNMQIIYIDVYTYMHICRCDIMKCNEYIQIIFIYVPIQLQPFKLWLSHGGCQLCNYDCKCVPKQVLYTRITRTLKCYCKTDTKEHPKLESANSRVYHPRKPAPTEAYNLRNFGWHFNQKPRSTKQKFGSFFEHQTHRHFKHQAALTKSEW